MIVSPSQLNLISRFLCLSVEFIPVEHMFLKTFIVFLPMKDEADSRVICRISPDRYTFRNSFILICVLMNH